MEYLEKLKIYGDQVKVVLVKSMVDTACGGQKMLKDALPGNLVTREYEVIPLTNDPSMDAVKYMRFCALARSSTRFGWSWSSVAHLRSDQTYYQTGSYDILATSSWKDDVSPFQEAAVFVLEKRLLDKYAKKDRDLIIDAMRKGSVGCLPFFSWK